MRFLFWGVVLLWIQVAVGYAAAKGAESHKVALCSTG